MPKVDIKRLDSTTANDTTATKTINDNFKALQEGLDEALSRTGEVPNYMLTDIDLNHNKLINLAEPTEDRDAVTLKYVKDVVGDAKKYEELAKGHAEKADKAVDAANIYLQKTITETNKATSAAALAEQAIELVTPIVEDEDVNIVAANIEAVNTTADNMEAVKGAVVSAQEAKDAAEEAKEAASKASGSLKVEMTPVEAALWTQDDSYADFPLAAKVYVKESKSSHTPTVIFDVAEATSGNFAPIAIAEDEAVTIFAKEQPSGDIIIPVIVLE